MKLTLEEANAIMNKNNGNLNLRGTPITQLPDNLTVGGRMNLSDTQITALPDNLTVSGWLDLSGTQITALRDNLMVGGSLYLDNTPITKLPDNLKVGGSLYLNNTPITKLPDNLTVGGSLNLSNTPIAKLPDNLTVGGWLDLCGTQITRLDNLTVGRWLDLRGSQLTKEELKKVKRLHNGDYIEGQYLYADGILTHIKKKKEIGKYALFIGKIPNRNVIFDGMYYAHCSTFREGKSDLLFKHAKDRGMEQYKGLSLDTELTADEMITMYRIITGACRQGTETFVNSLGKLKDRYTIGEALEITKGQYGAKQFAGFFS